jgi:hypothetical protein
LRQPSAGQEDERRSASYSDRHISKATLTKVGASASVTKDFSATVSIETLDPRLPRIATTTWSRGEDLCNIAARLKAVQLTAKRQEELIGERAKVNTSSEARPNPSVANRDLVHSVCELTDAVNKLTAAVREALDNKGIASNVGSPATATESIAPNERTAADVRSEHPAQK